MAYFGSNIIHSWVHFNGNDGTINDSYNVSSVSKYGTGFYQVYADVDMANTDYCVFINKRLSNSGTNSADKVFTSIVNSNLGTGSVRVFTRSDGGSMINCDDVYVAIIGDSA